jgi:hypothetical protein
VIAATNRLCSEYGLRPVSPAQKNRHRRSHG